MRIVADSNVLIRAIVRDDSKQAAMAGQALREADEIAVSISALCEFVWVLEKIYKRKRHEIAIAIRGLIGDRKIRYDRATVEAGLALLDAGGDFADGVIAFAGKQLGGEVFVTFDRKAARLIKAAGGEVNLLRG